MLRILMILLSPKTDFYQELKAYNHRGFSQICQMLLTLTACFEYLKEFNQTNPMQEEELKEKLNYSSKDAFQTIIIVLGAMVMLYLGKPVILPLVFALITSFIFYPVCVFLEKKGFNRMWAVVTSVFGGLLILGLAIYLIASRFLDIVTEFQDFQHRMQDLMVNTTAFLNDKVSIVKELKPDELKAMIDKWTTEKSDVFVKGMFSGTAAFLTNLVLIIVFTFLILLYRRGLKVGFIGFAREDKRKVYAQMIHRMREAGQHYLTGMCLLILILAVLYSLGLWAIGIDYPVLFGAFAACLAIVPYVGTTSGGILPTLYAFMMYESMWYGIGVILLFWVLQMLEANFLSPRIVGGNLGMNALVSIIALITGGFLWGIPGMIIALPSASLFKVFCEHYERLEPVAQLMRNDLYKRKKRSG